MRISTKIGYYIHGVTLGLAIIVMCEVSQGLKKMRTIRSDIKQIAQEMHEIHSTQDVIRCVGDCKSVTSMATGSCVSNVNELVVHVLMNDDDSANVRVYKLVPVK